MDLRWIINNMWQKKIIIFCSSISDSFCVFSYLWRQLNSPFNVRREQIRMYNALNWPDYNLKTCKLMQKPNGCQVIIVTDILMVGMDFPDINDVVIIGHPPNMNNYFQKIGHAGRDHSLIASPCRIMYIISHTKKAANEKLGIKPPTARKQKELVKAKPSGVPAAQNMKRARRQVQKPHPPSHCQEYEYFKLFLTHVLTFFHSNIEQYCATHFFHFPIPSHDISCRLCHSQTITLS